MPVVAELVGDGAEMRVLRNDGDHRLGERAGRAVIAPRPGGGDDRAATARENGAKAPHAQGAGPKMREALVPPKPKRIGECERTGAPWP